MRLISTFFRFGNEVIHLFTHVEVEWLKGIEYKVAHVLVHVSFHYAAIKIIDNPSTIHDLQNKKEKTPQIQFSFQQIRFIKIGKMVTFKLDGEINKFVFRLVPKVRQRKKIHSFPEESNHRHSDSAL